mmetsp:Transcript_38283/g.108228  ORF Transcript_38283/g.108228 Transcript_38283/m.108228 type:complete len:200 (+) Transcript_38283:124-723(+)
MGSAAQTISKAAPMPRTVNRAHAGELSSCARAGVALIKTRPAAAAHPLLGRRVAAMCSTGRAPAPGRRASTGIQTPAWAEAATGHALAALVSAALLMAPQPSIAASATENFASRCAGCHAGGGNVVQAGASLRSGDLKKNGIETPEQIYDLIYKGKGKMPGFGNDCAPRGQCTFTARFSDEEMSDMTTYVIDQAAADWK